jgi:hypothetical protein
MSAGSTFLRVKFLEKSWEAVRTDFHAKECGL